MIHWAKAFATKPDYLSSIPRIYTVEGENCPLTSTCCGACTLCLYKINKYNKVDYDIPYSVFSCDDPVRFLVTTKILVICTLLGHVICPNGSPPPRPSVYVYMDKCRYMCTIVPLCSSEDNLRCPSLPSTLLGTACWPERLRGGISLLLCLSHRSTRIIDMPCAPPFLCGI